MPPHPEPQFDYAYDVEKELGRLDAHFKTRGVPRKSDGLTLVASWNVANLGDPGQARSDADHRVIAHILRRFDVVAVQEVKDDLAAFRAVLKRMGGGYRAVFTDPAGNQERMAFVYDRKRIRTRELFGELALVDAKRKTFNVEYKNEVLRFKGFNRNPFMVAFGPRRGRRKTFDFTLVNVHLYYGAKSGRKLRDRLLEVMALSQWAQGRSDAETAYDPNIILLGDMNLPSLRPKSPFLKILKERGLRLTDYSSNVDRNGTNLGGDRPYDQIAFVPKKTEGDYAGKTGVFDFDAVLFPDLFRTRGVEDFRAYMKYHISDHRLLWAAFRA
ncbi:MAG: endonuclease/exonuclease/phosphatase family protein [Nitrospinota bacterium]